VSTPKAKWHVKDMLLTEATEVWIEAELAKNPTLTAQEILRNRLHSMALGEIRNATVLAGVAARRKIFMDGDGS
jgi:hypothetical protein